MSDPRPWEPDPSRMGNWRELFEPKRQAPSGPPPEPAAAPTVHAPLPDDYVDGGAGMAKPIDPTVYRPWLLQRGTRPPFMLELRRYEPRSGLWQGWQVSYPHLMAVEYTGDRLLSLDFGARQFTLEGNGLDVLAAAIQQGNVIRLQEYAAGVWPHPSDGPVIRAIRLTARE